jgi:hypothetical protein
MKLEDGKIVQSLEAKRRLRCQGVGNLGERNSLECNY